MSEPPPHQQFELQIERIHRLLDCQDSTITWDDHVRDPDCPAQFRQIDISIRRVDSLTLIECRFHKEPQDVTWIEELIGRRISLQADGVIAVSASGFTTTAQKKAVRYGIILRDFKALSEDEIRNWGLKRRIVISYCEFSQLIYTINVRKLSAIFPRITRADGMPLSPLTWYFPLREVMHRLDTEECSTTVTGLISNSFLVDGEPPNSVEIFAKVRRTLANASIFSVYGYIDPMSAERHAEVGQFNLGASEFIEHRDNLATLIDLSQIKIPDSCLFETVMTDAGRAVTMQLSLPVGLIATFSCQIPIIFRARLSDGQAIEIRRILVVEGTEEPGRCEEITLTATLSDQPFASPR